MKFGMVNKSTTVNRFVLHILHRNITHLAIITRKTNIKLGILKRGGNWKRASFNCETSDFTGLSLSPNLCFFMAYLYPTSVFLVPIGRCG